MYKLNKYQSYSDYNANIIDVPIPNVSKVFKGTSFDVKYNKKRGITFLDYIETDGNSWIVTDIAESVPNIIGKFYVTNLPNVAFENNLVLFTHNNYSTSGLTNATNITFIQNDGSQRVNLYCDRFNSASSTTRIVEVIRLQTTSNPVDQYVSVKFCAASGSSAAAVITNNLSDFTLTPSYTSNDTQTVQRSYLTIMGENVDSSIQARQLRAGSRCYGIDIYSDSTFGTMTHNLRPCSYFGELGLYDTINDKFYGNAGTGTFIAGSIVPKYPNYINDGLVLWLDGEYNTRSGHVTNLTTWEDLSGNNYDFDVIGPYVNVDQYSSLTANSNNVPFNKTYTLRNTNNNLQASAPASVVGTLEIVCENNDGTIGCAFSMYSSSSQPGKGFWYRPASNEIVTSFSQGQYTCSAISMSNDIALFSVIYPGQQKTASAIYKNGYSQTLSSSSGTMAQAVAASVGGRYANETEYSLNGKVYAIRLYNRILTQEEIQHNLYIDKDRFGIVWDN